MKKIVVLIATVLLTTLNAVEIDLSGSVVSDNQKMMTSRYMGYVRNMAVSEGDIVKKGQLLYEIDSKEIEAAERQVDLAAKNLKDMVTIAQEQVNQALAKKEEVLNQYNYLKITAPNDGVIVAKRINEGEMAIPGMPAVVLTDLSRLKIVAEISETQLPYIHLGKEVEIEIPSLALKTMGKISSIIPNSNPMTHKFKIKIEFEHKGKSVYPGMYTKIIIR